MDKYLELISDYPVIENAEQWPSHLGYSEMFSLPSQVDSQPLRGHLDDSRVWGQKQQWRHKERRELEQEKSSAASLPHPLGRLNAKGELHFALD